MHVLVGRGGEPVSLALGGLASIYTGWHYDEPGVVADLPITRDELAARGAAMLAQRGWDDAVEGGFDMADDCIEVAGWYDVGTMVEPEFDHDTGEWLWFVVEDDGQLIDVIELPSW
jgi:hypothetical protein